jgi:ATP-binding cassette subfamily B protein
MRDRLRGLAFLLVSMVRAEPVRSLAAVAVITAGRSAVLASAVGLRDLLNGAAARDASTATRGAFLVAAGIALGLAARYPIATVGVTLRERASMAIDERLARLSATLPSIVHLERPDFLDNLDLLRRGSFELGEAVGSLVDNIATVVLLVSSGVLLASVHPALLLMPAAAIPSLVAAVLKERETERFEQETAELYRPRRTLRDLAWTVGAGAELRLFGAAATILRRQADAAAGIDARRTVWAWRSGAIQAIGDAALGLGQAVGVGFVAVRVSRGQADAGDVALVIALAGQLSANVTEASEGLRWLARLLRLVHRMTWLAEHAEDAAMPDAASSDAPKRPVPDRLTSGLALRGVTFRYPGTEVDVLRGVDLDVAAGTTVAFVGENGAGKTSLVKLLCGFYEPTSGSIAVDGVPLRDLDTDGWRRRTTASFQDFAHLELLTREAVGVGDLPRVEDRPAVEAAVDRGDARELVDRLADGIETQLGTQFDGGVELSGGEWQRVALARSAMREEPLLLLLDEPTAALDPLAEQALFDRIVALARARREAGMVAVFVSHRFSTVRMADLIVVLEEGVIAERGTHAELVALGGRYAELFERQARAYR